MKLFILIAIFLGTIISQKAEPSNDMNKHIQCRICQEMFSIDFNIDQFMNNNNKVNIVKSFIQNIFPNRSAEVNNILSSDNLQFMTQEISMQYFFKGAENQIDQKYAPQLQQCKMKLSGSDATCDSIKLNICESILSFNSGYCSVMPKVEISMPIPQVNLMQQIQNQINPLNQMMKNINKAQPIPENISLIELTPNYIESNFDSKPKTQWTPPKPVLLENFERSMGDQLKEISYLTTEIAKYEKKLKQYKQELSNKLETFQSSYKVIQKTISEITKLVNQPSLSEFIKSPSQFTEDDWDESSKSKFLNN